jgi:restriction system protein
MSASHIVNQLIMQLLTTFWWVIPLFILGTLLKMPFMKGVFGEFQVNWAAKFFLDKETYTLFKNVTLKTEDGTTQIDHIIVSRFGVFVIETKNMKGWIFGDAHQKTWTQKIYRHTTKFQNPLHQNYKHTKTLQDALMLDADKVFSVIVFVGDSTFKTAMPDNVVYTGGYIRFIKSKRQAILNDNEVQEICSAIKSGRLTPSIRTQLDHVRHVKTIVEKKANDNSCPKCGMPMVLRTSRKGNTQGNQFFGCSAYPKCKTVKQLA